MEKVLFRLYRLVFQIIPTLFFCAISGLKFDSSWLIKGRIHVLRRKWYDRIFRGHEGGSITIGKNFKCNNRIESNSIGIIQPCVFNVEIDGSRIIIGNNVGISGSTINASTQIRIDDNALIGSGCLISDTDSHPLDYSSRINNDNTKIATAPIHICEGVFVGARSIILKGVTIGAHSVIGAGAVVARDIPENCIAYGNPIVIAKKEGVL